MTSVLIVEDVDSMRELLEQMVSSIAGVKVSGVAKNSWEARLELGRRKPELVLLDEVLPGESSLELLAEIRTLGLPVILITGGSFGGEQRHPHEIPAGAAGRLSKPSWDRLDEDRERFRTAIAQVLDSGTLSG